MTTASDPRPIERIREHYRIEKELARQLRVASREQRRRLYACVYNELFRRVTDHPQLAGKNDPDTTAALLANQIRLLMPLLHPGLIVLEVGSGDCALARAIAPRVKAVYAVDVSSGIMQQSAPMPANVVRVVCDGAALPVPDARVDLAFSNQLMEHLHPDDAVEQLRAIRRALAPGGRYLCVTPNRLSGPYDISRYFDPVATGLHLKEYTVAELAGLFHAAGFSRLRVVFGASRIGGILLPVPAITLLERILQCFPARMCVTMARRLPIGVLRVIILLGTKEGSADV